jgi:hypothetical protein
MTNQLIIWPSFVDTPILGENYAPAVKEMLQSKGLDFALPEDCAKAALRIATDGDINGKHLLCDDMKVV